MNSFGLQGLSRLQRWMAVLVAICAAVIFLLASSWSKKRRIRNLGTFAAIAPYWMPFGLDLMVTIISRLEAFQFFEWTREILEVPGHTVELLMMGIRVVMTDEPENLKAILSTQFSEFGKGDVFHKTFYSVFRDSVFSTDGSIWQANKHQLRPHLSRKRSTDLKTTEEHIAQLILHLEKPEEVDVCNLIDRFQLDVVTHVFCGESANSLETDRQQLRDAINTLLRFNSTRMIFGSFGLLFPDTIFARKATKQLENYMNAHAQKAISSGKAIGKKQSESEMTFIETIGSRSSLQEVKSQLVAVLLAAKDPVAITLSWAIYELSRHPEIVKILQQEIKDNMGLDSILEERHLKNMSYLNNVVRETTRLYHPIGFNIRQAIRDTTIPVGGGDDGKQPVTILKGAHVIYSTIGLHRRHDLVGPDADQWKPERWETWTPDRWQYVPFNRGPRVCLGRAFGQFQVEYTIARILQEFKSIEGCGREQRIKIEMNTKMAYPILCRFHRE